MEEDKKGITIWISKDTWRRFSIACVLTGKSKTAVLKEAIDKFVKENNQ